MSIPAKFIGVFDPFLLCFALLKLSIMYEPAPNPTQQWKVKILQLLKCKDIEEEKREWQAGAGLNFPEWNHQ